MTIECRPLPPKEDLFGQKSNVCNTVCAVEEFVTFRWNDILAHIGWLNSL